MAPATSAMKRRGWTEAELQPLFSALEVAGQEAASVRQHEERQMRATAEKLRLETKELKRK